jgi:hypothetical protein
MPHYLTPHSPEWFRALEAFDPDQAAMTRQVLALAGRNDVCSICGDYPAKDYHLVDKHLAPEAVATLRLCDDCHQIRKTVYGETFAPYGPKDRS